MLEPVAHMGRKVPTALPTPGVMPQIVVSFEDELLSNQRRRRSRILSRIVYDVLSYREERPGMPFVTELSAATLYIQRVWLAAFWEIGEQHCHVSATYVRNGLEGNNDDMKSLINNAKRIPSGMYYSPMHGATSRNSVSPQAKSINGGSFVRKFQHPINLKMFATCVWNK